MYDEIEITTTRRIENELPIRRIYEYEENTEVLITNSKSENEVLIDNKAKSQIM